MSVTVRMAKLARTISASQQRVAARINDIRLGPVDDLLRAMRVPETLEEQKFGLWQIKRQRFTDTALILMVGNSSLTALDRVITCRHRREAMEAKRVHLMKDGDVLMETVMEDSRNELQRHLPVLVAARGRVLVTGLGLGCVLRGLLAKPTVEHVDVVEIDAGIMRVIGPEFIGNPRVTLHFGDALTYQWPADTRWDFAWHDIHELDVDSEPLQKLHAMLFDRYFDMARRQGAWEFPRDVRRGLKRARNGDHWL